MGFCFNAGRLEPGSSGLAGVSGGDARYLKAGQGGVQGLPSGGAWLCRCRRSDEMMQMHTQEETVARGKEINMTLWLKSRQKYIVFIGKGRKKGVTHPWDKND